MRYGLAFLCCCTCSNLGLVGCSNLGFRDGLSRWAFAMICYYSYWLSRRGCRVQFVGTTVSPCCNRTRLVATQQGNCNIVHNIVHQSTVVGTIYVRNICIKSLAYCNRTTETTVTPLSFLVATEQGLLQPNKPTIT